MSEDITWARKVLEDATPGPWQTHGGRDAFWQRSVRGAGDTEVAWCGDASPQAAYADAGSIALLGSTGLAMLDVIEAAECLPGDVPPPRDSYEADQAAEELKVASDRFDVALDKYYAALKEARELAEQ